MNGLYRFYNMNVSRHGEPIALCDAHHKSQPRPSACVLEKIGTTNDACRKCVEDEERRRKKEEEEWRSEEWYDEET